MANQGRHKKSPVLEWLEGEEGNAPTKSRGSHVVDSYIKKSKVALKRPRAAAAPSAPQKVEPAQLREPGPPARAVAKPSQAASWEHQRKVERLAQLRAPHHYRSR
jgi:hypothetical protein